MNDLTGAPLLGRLLTVPENIRLGLSSLVLCLLVWLEPTRVNDLTGDPHLGRLWPYLKTLD